MTTHKQKRKALEADGWKVGTAQEFLRLSDGEVALIDLKLALGRALKECRIVVLDPDVAKRFRGSAAVNEALRKLLKRSDRGDVRSEYDLAKLGKGTRGKYFKRYQKGSNVVVIDPKGPKRSRTPRP